MQVKYITHLMIMMETIKTKPMKNKIKEVQNYFADKIARGLYKVEKCDKYSIDVTVDKEYTFCLWVANGGGAFRTWDSGKNSMPVKFTAPQQSKGYKAARKHQQHWMDTELRDKELAELKKLQEKYPV